MFSCVEEIAVIEFVRIALMGGYLFALQCIVLERLLAIIFLTTYECQVNPWFTPMFIIAELLSIIVVFVFMCSSKFLELKLPKV